MSLTHDLIFNLEHRTIEGGLKTILGKTPKTHVGRNQPASGDSDYGDADFDDEMLDEEITGKDAQTVRRELREVIQ